MGFSHEQITGSLRLTTGIFNNEKDIEQTVTSLKIIVKELRSVSPFKEKHFFNKLKIFWNSFIKTKKIFSHVVWKDLLILIVFSKINSPKDEKRKIFCKECKKKNENKEIFLIFCPKCDSSDVKLLDRKEANIREIEV